MLGPGVRRVVLNEATDLLFPRHEPTFFANSIPLSKIRDLQHTIQKPSHPNDKLTLPAQHSDIHNLKLEKALMSTASQSYMVAAYFHKQSDAENAIRELQKAGFRSNQIGTSFDDFDQEDWGDVTKRPSNKLTSDEYSPNSANATAAGHPESFWEKVKDFFSGETADSDINDHSVTSRAHQDITDRAWQTGGSWDRTGFRIPATYNDRLTKGGVLVTVAAADRAKEAENILTRSHGEIERDFSSWNKDTAAGMGQGTRADITGGTLPSDYNTLGGAETAVPSAIAARNSGLSSNREAEVNRNRAANVGNPQNMNADRDERRIQLISEVLRVRKERVARGEVRLRKEVRTETQNIQVPVTHEEIVIERNPVEGQRTAAGQIGAEKEIRVPLSEERVQVEKVPVVTEEVKVGKRTVSNTENVRDQVRREELNVEGADENLRGKVNRKENQKIRDKNDPSRKIA